MDYIHKDEMTYRPPKYFYIKTDKDIYKLYKKESKKPVSYLVFLEIITLFITHLLKRTLSEPKVLLPYVGIISSKLVRRKFGKPIFDFSKAYHEGIVTKVSFTDKYPKLVFNKAGYRYRNAGFYELIPKKITKSVLFKTHLNI
jgi:hypothetical protein